MLPRIVSFLLLPLLFLGISFMLRGGGGRRHSRHGCKLPASNIWDNMLLSLSKSKDLERMAFLEVLSKIMRNYFFPINSQKKLSFHLVGTNRVMGAISHNENDLGADQFRCKSHIDS